LKIVLKILKVIYRLDLLNKIKIYPVQYIIIFKSVYKDFKLLVYKIDIYKRLKRKQIIN